MSTGHTTFYPSRKSTCLDIAPYIFILLCHYIFNMCSYGRVLLPYSGEPLGKPKYKSEGNNMSHIKNLVM